MRRILVGALIIGALLGGQTTHAQCRVPRERIPPDWPPTVSKHARSLYSEDRSRRTRGAYELSKWVNRYPELQPFLVGMLHDSRSIAAWQVPDHPWAKITTSPGREAAKGLVQAEAADALLEALRTGKTRGTRQNAALALGLLGEKRAVPIMLEKIWNPGYHEALGHIGDPRAIEPMIGELSTNRTPHRT